MQHSQDARAAQPGELDRQRSHAARGARMRNGIGRFDMQRLVDALERGQALVANPPAARMSGHSGKGATWCAATAASSA